MLTWLPLASFSTLTLDAAPFDATNTDAQRSAARIAVVVNGVTVTLATTMLASDPTSRQVQIDRLQSWMSTATAPRLIGGSFNMRSTDPGYSDMASAARDVWSALVTTPDGGTTVESFGTAGQPARVDDWWQDLGTPRALATEVWIVKTGRSDHHAVIAEVNVR
jgi:endonuclease/exonuclease/phosphatase family metal-dependent hydrolase